MFILLVLTLLIPLHILIWELLDFHIFVPALYVWVLFLKCPKKAKFFHCQELITLMLKARVQESRSCYSTPSVSLAVHFLHLSSFSKVKYLTKIRNKNNIYVPTVLKMYTGLCIAWKSSPHLFLLHCLLLNIHQRTLADVSVCAEASEVLPC